MSEDGPNPTRSTRLDWLRERVEQVLQQPAVQPLRPSERARLHRLESELSIANAENEHLRTRLADARASLELRGNAVLELRVRIQQEVERFRALEKELSKLRDEYAARVDYTRRIQLSLDGCSSALKFSAKDLTEERRISAHLRTQLAAAMAEAKRLRETVNWRRGSLRLPPSIDVHRTPDTANKRIVCTVDGDPVAYITRIGSHLHMTFPAWPGVRKKAFIDDAVYLNADLIQHLRATRSITATATIRIVGPGLADLLKEI